MSQVFIVGQVFDSENNQWCIHGVYDTQAAAVNACADGNYFVLPLFVNVPVPDGNIDLAVTYYPFLAKTKTPTAIVEKLPGRSKPKRIKNE